jgi:RNase P subunit RPR2
MNNIDTLQQLLRQLSDMDYKTSKYVDGEYTAEQWATICEERKAIRDQIREIEPLAEQEIKENRAKFKEILEKIHTDTRATEQAILPKFSIDEKYKISLTGVRNKAVKWCPECHAEVPIYDNAIGFADSTIGDVIVVECPQCYEKYYFHSRKSYPKFLKAIDNGTQKHFNNENQTL